MTTNPEITDDGLREALDSLCRDHEAEAEGGGFCDIDTIWPSQIRAVLAAHPAPHPRPVVDPEALIKAFGVVYLENMLYDHEIDALADAVLALLRTGDEAKA